MKLSGIRIGSSISMDIGTANTMLLVKGKGIVVREPSVVAIEKYNQNVLAVGNEADEMLGRTPDNIMAIHPIRDGVINDFEITEALIKKLMLVALGKKGIVFKPSVTVSVPTGITNVEKRALVQAITLAGAKSVTMIEEPVAAALGAGIDIMKPEGIMVVNIGGGTCEVAVIALGGVVASKSMRIAGCAMNDSISAYIKRKYSVTVGDKTAEEVKQKLGYAGSMSDSESYEVRGRDIMTGLPKTIYVKADEIAGAMAETISYIIEEIRDTLEITPPELTADIMKNGIVLTGGGALIKNIDKTINSEIGVPVRIADEPIECVINGINLATENSEIIMRSSVARRG